MACRIDDANDVTQCAVVRLLASARRFRGASVGELHAYAGTIALHEAFTLLRRQRKERARTVALEICEDVPQSERTWLPRREAALSEIELAVARLPTEKRELLGLYYERNMSAVQIARLSYVTEATVRSRIRRALRALERQMGSAAHEGALERADRSPGIAAQGGRYPERGNLKRTPRPRARGAGLQT